MKKKNEINGTFHAVVSVRGADNIQSFSLVSIKVKDGVVVETVQSQPDVPAITFHRADRTLRDETKPIEEVLNAKA